MSLIYYFQQPSRYILVDLQLQSNSSILIWIVRYLYEEYIFDLSAVLRKAMMQWLTNLKQTCDWIYFWHRKRKKVDAFLSKINIEDYAGSYDLVLENTCQKVYKQYVFLTVAKFLYDRWGKRLIEKVVALSHCISLSVYSWPSKFFAFWCCPQMYITWIQFQEINVDM